MARSRDRRNSHRFTAGRFDPELTVEGSAISTRRHCLADSTRDRKFCRLATASFHRKRAPKLLKNGPKRGQNLVAALGGLGKLRDIVAVLPIDRPWRFMRSVRVSASFGRRANSAAGPGHSGTDSIRNRTQPAAVRTGNPAVSRDRSVATHCYADGAGEGFESAECFRIG